jgi:ketosteroid isomerase-like protein
MIGRSDLDRYGARGAKAGGASRFGITEDTAFRAHSRYVQTRLALWVIHVIRASGQRLPFPLTPDYFGIAAPSERAVLAGWSDRQPLVGLSYLLDSTNLRSTGLYRPDGQFRNFDAIKLTKFPRDFQQTTNGKWLREAVMEQKTEREAEIRSLIEDWAKSVRAHEIDGVLACHSPDILMFDVVGPTKLCGLQAYRESWVEQFFPWHGDGGAFELRELEITAGERVAFATALLDCAGTENGKHVQYTLRLTIGLKKMQPGWIIVHEHHSEPLTPTTP